MAINQDIIALIYRRAISPTGEENFLREVSRLLEAKSGWVWSYSFSDSECKILSSSGINDTYIQSYVEKYVRLNPWLKDQALYAQPGAVVTGRSVIKRHDLANTNFFAEWLDPQGICDRIAGVIAVDDDRITAFEFFREQSSPLFGRKEAALCADMLTHWQAADKMRLAMNTVERERDAAWQLLERLPFGVALVNPSCEPVATNKYFAALLKTPDGLKLQRKGLYGPSHGGSDTLQAMVAEASAKPVNGKIWQGVMMLSRAAGQRPLQVMVSALPCRKGASSATDASAVVFVLNPDQVSGPNQKTLRQFYGLTNSEARLASLVSQGLRLDEATKTMGVALNTGRTHLKRIFSKTGTQRQAELVQLLLSGPALLVENPGQTLAKGQGGQ